MEIPRDMKDPDTLTQISRFQFIYGLCGLALCLVCTVGSIYLFVSGVTGSISISTELFGKKSAVTDAAPGVLLFFVGLAIACITRFSVKLK